MRAHPPLRLARAAAFAAVCVTLAALAHAVSGGSPPAPGTAGLGLGAVFVLALALSGRERPAALINAVLVAAQFALHELFGSGDGTGYVTTHLPGHALASRLAGTTAGHGPAGLSGFGGPGEVGAVHGLGAHEVPGGFAALGGFGELGGLGNDVGMLLAHVTATLLTGWWLARGEAALWALLRHLDHRLDGRLVLLRLPALSPVRRAAPVVRVRAVPVDPAFRHSVARRGPPRPA